MHRGTCSGVVLPLINALIQGKFTNNIATLMYEDSEVLIDCLFQFQPDNYYIIAGNNNSRHQANPCRACS